MSTTEIKIELDELEKRKLEKNANSMGLSVEAVIKLMIDQFNRSCRIKRKDSLDDFSTLPREVEEAMLIAKAEEFGLIKDTSEEVHNIESLRRRWLDK
ncbi:hypothetical protein [Xylocopilactobacillus apicola]|uniref:Damage-inducible protein J n=1 Tax=Xylocopilactobacillus apicola TaxID=2932184 RepID=A0AAU9D2F5_9LACO|nr:hypothetical protein [Xylocopilactobacillus apicola]BDR57673.1 hypothetical protein XA3_01140 [Xylocopilactobacillus apicola]